VADIRLTTITNGCPDGRRSALRFVRFVLFVVRTLQFVPARSRERCTGLIELGRIAGLLLCPVRVPERVEHESG
jgi:hypothetical protein